MQIQGVFGVAMVRDIKAGEAWWTRFLGRAPDDRPMPGLIQWRTGGAGIQLFEDAERAGGSDMTIVSPDLTEALSRLKGEGLMPDDDFGGTFGRVTRWTDPDGNRIALTEPPRG